MNLYIATSNPGKLRDFAAAAAQRISMKPLPGLKEIEPPHEDQPTFAGNARLKAIYYSRHAPGHIALRNTPETHRQARYHCVLAAARDGEILCTGDGTVEGQILTAPRGAHGFGYDPLFYLPQHNKTMAELDAATKLSFSHRGRAFDALLNALLPILHPTTVR